MTTTKKHQGGHVDKTEPKQLSDLMDVLSSDKNIRRNFEEVEARAEKIVEKRRKENMTEVEVEALRLHAFQEEAFRAWRRLNRPSFKERLVDKLETAAITTVVIGGTVVAAGALSSWLRPGVRTTATDTNAETTNGEGGSIFGDEVTDFRATDRPSRKVS